MTRIVALFWVAAAVLSCNDVAGGCIDDSRLPAFDLEIRDSVTSAPIAETAVATVLNGPFVDSLPLCEQTSGGVWLSRCGPDERAGTYDILVIHPNHQSWSVHGVFVPHDACHVQTVRLQIRMQQR